MKKVESAIQRELIKWLREEYPFIEPRYNKLENKKNVLEAVDDKRMGFAVAGTPDLTLFIHKEDYTYILELELKTKKGSLNKNQDDWWAEFRPNQNRQGEIAYGFNEAKIKIKNWVDSIIK
jgi:hypothetical protein